MKRSATILSLMVLTFSITWLRSNNPNLNHSSNHDLAGSKKAAVTKCVTKDGQVHFGNVPSDVVCEKSENMQLEVEPAIPLVTTQQTDEHSAFHCDGRQYCSQMTSCPEAVFFMKNCPDTKMDGDGDRVPCESQWCY